MKKKRNVKAWIWLILGILLVGYYGIESLFVGFTFSLLWIWAAMGAVCLLCAALTFRFGRLPLPKWLFIAICTTVASVILSGKMLKNKQWLRVLYIVGMLLISLLVACRYFYITL